jgi:hypothetical protein
MDLSLAGCRVPPVVEASTGVGVYPRPLRPLVIGNHTEKKTTLSFDR